jgi:AraC family transcriptional regulator, regulatory protein of adaptative response / methylphosphotriester-DNA alkyltransferase methyltransferase
LFRQLSNHGGLVPDLFARTPRPATLQLRAALLADADALIDAELDRPLQLDDVAHRIATSRRQLQRVYAELAGTSFRERVTQRRMDHAAGLLRTTDLPVRTIAERVGYRQAAQFAKAFRRVYGIAPHAYRARAAGAAANGDLAAA